MKLSRSVTGCSNGLNLMMIRFKEDKCEVLYLGPETKLQLRTRKHRCSVKGFQ